MIVQRKVIYRVSLAASATATMTVGYEDVEGDYHIASIHTGVLCQCFDRMEVEIRSITLMVLILVCRCAAYCPAFYVVDNFEISFFHW